MIARLFTLLFIFTAYLGPEKIFGSLVQLHVQIIIGVIAILVSLPGAVENFQPPPPQAYAMFGLTIAVFLSLIANSWISGAFNAVDAFVPQAITFFLVIFNFRTKRQLQLVVVVLLVASFFIIYSGYRDLQTGKFDSPYLISQGNDKGEVFYRLRGETFIGDPNDFAQLLVCLIPLTFFFWIRKHRIRNLLFVYLPIGILIYGMYLTHSRGGVLALLATLLMAGRKRIGTIPSAILAGLGFLGTMAIGWTGGRDISVEAGEGRMDAWAEGLKLIQSHPIFGVGYNRFTEFYFITAHNTIVVCAAELGILGFFFWVLFVVPSYANSWNVANFNTITKIQQEAPPQSDIAYSSSDPFTIDAQPIVRPPLVSLESAEIARLGQIMLLSLTAFLAAGWFISRSYVMTLFIIGGFAQVIFKSATQAGIVNTGMNWNKLLKMTSATTVSLLILVYIILRVSNLSR